VEVKNDDRSSIPSILLEKNEYLIIEIDGIEGYLTVCDGHYGLTVSMEGNQKIDWFMREHSQMKKV